MSERVTLIAASEDVGERVDVFLSRSIDHVSRTLASGLARESRVRINGVAVRASHRLARGDTVDVDVVRPPSLSAKPEQIPLEIVYEDGDLVVINKPAGLVVHPAPGHAGGTLANALAARFPQTQEVGGVGRPGIVHRLDKDTSGLLVVALTPLSHASLQQQISSREAGRRYLALVEGHLQRPAGTIAAPIGRDPRDRKRMAVNGIAARSARTSYRLLESLLGFDYVEATLDTGRTHQIRVHLAAIGHPVAADSIYGGSPIRSLERQFLHAHHLSLQSPSSGERLTFSAPLPADLQLVLDRLRRATA